MARFIQTVGTVTEVRPERDTFTSAELHVYIPGRLVGIPLISERRGLFMWMEKESMENGLTENHAATEILHQHRPDLVYLTIYGDILITE